MTFNNLFICYDGENTKENYFLLGNSYEHIYNKKGLTSRKCLEFLTHKHKKKRIIFNLHYDLQFWIKDLPDKKILDLMNGLPVYFYQYRLEYFYKKMLIIKKKNSIYKIYDILSFFDRSLLNVVDLLSISLSSNDLKILQKGKSSRTDFSKMKLADIIIYNQTECITTEKIAGKIYTLMLNSYYKDKENKTQNLVVSNFFGSSAIASKLLRSYKINKLKKFNRYWDIFSSAYYGGRFEVLKLGEYKNIYKYDINSAYPSVIAGLRQVKKFKKVKNPKLVMDEGIYLLYYKQIYPNDFICPFPLRHKSGRIFYTGEISGYYFGYEINAFLSSGCNKENYILKIFSGIEPVFGNEIFTNKNGYNLITDLFSLRNKYKQADDLRHYLLKKVLNSLYGKLAQTVGSHRYSNLYYAGLITAKIRSDLIKASFEIDYTKIISYATDCILSTKPLKVKTGSDLGEWEFQKIKKADIIMSGFYKLETTEKKYYYGLRGFNFPSKIFDSILKEVKLKGNSNIKINQFITHKLAIKNKTAYQNKRLVFFPITKKIDLQKSNFKRKYFFNNLFTSNKSYFHIFEQIKSVKLKKLDSLQDDFLLDY